MIHDGAAVVGDFVARGLVFGVALEPDRLLAFAGRASKFTRHDFEPGHFTVSAVLADRAACKVFLIRHPKLGRWLQPGGHFEPADPSVRAAAVREALEETGYSLDAKAARPVALSIHRIPAWGREPSHLHLDLQFLFDVTADAQRSPAQLRGRWFALSAEEASGALEHTLERVRLLAGEVSTRDALADTAQ